MKYECYQCSYKTNASGNYCRHQKSQKHIEKINQPPKSPICYHKVTPNNPKNDDKKETKQHICSNCHAEFVFRQGLSRHKKTCNIKNDDNKIEKMEQMIEKLMEKNEILQQEIKN